MKNEKMIDMIEALSLNINKACGVASCAALACDQSIGVIARNDDIQFAFMDVVELLDKSKGILNALQKMCGQQET